MASINDIEDEAELQKMVRSSFSALFVHMTHQCRTFSFSYQLLKILMNEKLFERDI